MGRFHVLVRFGSCLQYALRIRNRQLKFMLDLYFHWLCQNRPDLPNGKSISDLWQDLRPSSLWEEALFESVQNQERQSWRRWESTQKRRVGQAGTDQEAVVAHSTHTVQKPVGQYGHSISIHDDAPVRTRDTIIKNNVKEVEYIMKNTQA